MSGMTFQGRTDASTLVSSGPEDTNEVGESPILVQISQTLFRHKWLIAAAGLAGLLLGLAVTLLTPAIYSATTRLQINPEPTEVIDLGGVDSTSQRDLVTDQTALGLLQSRSLAERVVRSLNLTNDPQVANQELARSARQRVARDFVRSNTTVEPVRSSRLVDVSVSSRNRELAARIANSTADNFIRAGMDLRFEQSAFVRDYLEERLKAIRTTLEDSERALVGFERQNGIVTIQSESGGTTSSQTINNAELASVANALAEAQTKRIAAEQRFRQFEPLARSGASGGDSALQTQLSSLRAERAQKSEVFQDDYPEIVELDQKIRVLQNEIQRGNSNNAQTIGAEYRTALGEERALRQKLTELRGSVLDERSDNARYTILSRDVDTNRELYNALLQRYKEVGVAGGVGENEVAIVDRASVPIIPVSPILPLNLAVGLFLGILLGLLGSFSYDMLREFVNGPDDVQTRLGLKSLGVIPLVEDGEAMSELDDPKSSITESYLAAANLLRFASNEGVPQVLVLTSSLPEEGKSSSSYGLARSFARIGSRTLLIDADLRRPTFRAGDKAEKGLTHLLTGHSDIDEVLREGKGGVSLIPAGGTPPNPSELFAGGKIREILDKLRLRFDVIIIDAPPILGFVDAPALAGLADGTIMIVESGRVRVPHARSSAAKLRSANANIVGVIITKYKSSGDAYGYSYAYDYKYEGSGNSDTENRRAIDV